MTTHDRLENTIERVLATEGHGGIVALARLTSEVLEELPPRARLRKMHVVELVDGQEGPWAFGAERHMRRWYTITRNEEGAVFTISTWEKEIGEPEEPRQEALTCTDTEAVLAVLRAQPVPLEEWERILAFPPHMYVYGLVDPFDGSVHLIAVSKKPQQRIPTTQEKENVELHTWVRELERRGFAPQIKILDILPPLAPQDRLVVSAKRRWIARAQQEGWPIANRDLTGGTSPVSRSQLYAMSGAGDGGHQFTQGDRVLHSRFGEGVVLLSEGAPPNEFVLVQFEERPQPLRLSLAFAKLQKITPERGAPEQG
jgi:hypothetical protein